MATIKEITALCREGRTREAYSLARADMETEPGNPWKQRGVGWALYYLIKEDADTGNFQMLVAHLNELKALSQLSIPADNMIFENVLFKIGGFVKKLILAKANGIPDKLSTLFSILRGYNFEPSKGYSYFLSCCIKYPAWAELADFLDWWNFDKLTQDDYSPYETEDGTKVMAVAEQAFIAKSKALLQLSDRARIEAFLPVLDHLIDTHPEMLYPGYFYGKLLLAMGNSQEEALEAVLPFARKKATEFWVWQLLSDLFTHDEKKRLACLLRAVNCHTPDKYLVKVRIKLAAFFIQHHMLDCAKYQIDRVTACYLQQGWRLPYEVECWVHQDWIKQVTANDSAPIDFMAITIGILYKGVQKAIAIVTRVEQVPRGERRVDLSTLVYGKEKSLKQRLHFKVNVGDVVKIYFHTIPNGKTMLLNAEKVSSVPNTDYARIVEGPVNRKPDKPFAFLRTKKASYYISPHFVERCHLQDGVRMKGLFVYLYNPQKEKWGWGCVKNIKVDP